jgi:anti-sigma B factor antagonist
MTENKIIQSSRSQNEVSVVLLKGALEATLAKDLREELEKVSQQQNDLVLDFQQVSFIDSSCLGTLVSLAKDLREKKGDIKITGLADDVRSIFQITRLDRVFQLYDTVDEAVEAYYK